MNGQPKPNIIDESKVLYRNRFVPKGMARITYFTPPHTLRWLKVEAPVVDLLEEIHSIFVLNSGYQHGLLTVSDWSPNRQRFTAYFTENPKFQIGITRKLLSPTKYHFGIYITDMNDVNGGMSEDFQEFKTMFIDLKQRTLEEVADET